MIIDWAIQRETGTTNIRHLTVVLSWRGIWCKTSASDFLTPSPGEISLSSPPVCSSVISSPTTTLIPSVLPAVLRHKLLLLILSPFRRISIGMCVRRQYFFIIEFVDNIFILCNYIGIPANIVFPCI